jgi:anti-sigma factor RsiW
MTYTHGNHIHDDPNALLDYLYEEGEPSERLRIARHLQDCATCSVAVLELQSVRGMLNQWTPPASDLGFKVVRDPAPDADRQGWRGWLSAPRVPRWAQAAAGIVFFIAGFGFSQLHVEYANGALTVRTRSVTQLAAARTNIMLPAAPVATTPSASPSDDRALENAAGLTKVSAQNSDEVLRRVKAMIDQSEGRQQRELALRLSQLIQDFDTQRRADLLHVEQNFGQLEGQTGAEVAQQRELLNSLVKVSQSK